MEPPVHAEQQWVLSEETEAPQWMRPDELSKQQPIYIFNAGLVLLHPFLPALFKSQGWIKNKQFVDRQARSRAIYLLHYLATGHSKAPEYELTFNKILCGLPVEASLDSNIRLSKKMKTEADNLLLAVIQHWGVLKKTTPDELRANFLLRDGRLLEREGRYSLLVDNKSYDLLLNQLPWGFRTIQLSWMQSYVSVEWNF